VTALSLAGRRVLVVEDDAMIAMMWETALLDAGCTVVGPVSRVRAALSALKGDKIDAALLDVQLGIESVFAVADTLAADHIPFVFLTGYGAIALPERFRGRPALTKPCRLQDLVTAVAQVIDRPVL
jgi:CheY-like chemotaxis protein